MVIVGLVLVLVLVLGQVLGQVLVLVLERVATRMWWRPCVRCFVRRDSRLLWMRSSPRVVVC